MAQGPIPKTEPIESTTLADPPAPRRVAAVRLTRFGPYALGVLVTLVVVLLVNLLASGSPPPLTQHQVDDAIASALASITPPPDRAQLVYEAVQPSLVLIETTGTPGSGESEDGEPTGLGSGVVVTQDGDILTALHVVDGATSIKLTFSDGSTSAGEVTVSQPEHDIAVVHATTPPPTLVPATLGNPGAVRQGNEAYALGSPFGLYGSVSAGIISGLDRSFKMPGKGPKITGLFQIDAAVNPGNSGGALVDRDGRLIGIVTALVNPTKQDVFIGIGLAVPIDVAGGAAGLPPY